MPTLDEPPYATLYRACISGDGTSCEEFFRLLRPVLERVASRIARQWSAVGETDDVMQEIHLKLVTASASIGKMASGPSGQAVAYFSVLAANAARDFFRRRDYQLRHVDKSASIDDAIERLTGGKDAGTLDRDLLFSRIEECLMGQPRERTIYRLYYRQGFSAREISEIAGLGLTCEGVESLILRLTKQIKKCLGDRSGGILTQGKGNAPRRRFPGMGA